MECHVAGAQLAVTRDIAANVESLKRAIAYAARVGADVLLTPEGALSGYTPEFDRVDVCRALLDVTSCARRAGVGLALGTCFEEDDGKCYNQMRFYESDGHYLGFHSKQLRCGTFSASPEGEINDYAAVPLQVFKFENVKIGGLICNDLWANPECTPMADPHLTQQLASMGARIVFHAVNGGRDGGEWSEVAWRYHESNLRMRARAGGLWIVTVDSAHPVSLPCSAPSGVLDPEGNWVCQTAPRGEQFFHYAISL